MRKTKKELNSRILLVLIVIWLFILIINSFFSYTSLITGRVVGLNAGTVNFYVVAREEVLIPDSGMVNFTNPIIQKTIPVIDGLKQCLGDKLNITLYEKGYPSWSESEPVKVEVKETLKFFEITCNCSVSGQYKLFFNLSKSVLGNTNQSNIRLFVFETDWIELPTTLVSSNVDSTEFYSIVPHFSKFLIGEKAVQETTEPAQNPSGGGGGKRLLITGKAEETPEKETLEILNKSEEKPEETILFDVKVRIIPKYKEVLAGNTLVAEITLYNVEGKGAKETKVTYYIKNLEGKVLRQEEETVAVKDKVTIVKELFLPKELEPKHTYLLLYALLSPVIET